MEQVLVVSLYYGTHYGHILEFDPLRNGPMEKSSTGQSTSRHQTSLKSEKSWVVSTQNEDLADDRQLFILCPADSNSLYTPHIIRIGQQGRQGNR